MENELLYDGGNTSTKVVIEDIVVAKDVEEWINFIKEIVEN